MSTQTNCQRLHAHGFLIHLGFMYPPNYQENLIVDSVIVKRKNQYSVESILARSGRKLMRGITVCARAGLTDSQAFDVLKQRNFTKKYKTNQDIGRTTFQRYIKIVRDRLGLPRKSKKYLVIEFFKAGVPVPTICKKINSQLHYVRTVLLDEGLIGNVYGNKQVQILTHQHIKISKRKGVSNGKLKSV